MQSWKAIVTEVSNLVEKIHQEPTLDQKRVKIARILHL